MLLMLLWYNAYHVDDNSLKDSVHDTVRFRFLIPFLIENISLYSIPSPKLVE